MASAFTHGIVGLALAAVWPSRNALPGARWRLYALAAGCSILPDVDVVAFPLRILYGSFLGHRGFSHSIVFAAIVGVAVAWAALRDVPAWSRTWWSLAALLFVATASHGVLDALTDGGKGVAFFSPFVLDRFFLPWRPIHVSPVVPGQFAGARGLAILANEAKWVWLPVIALVGVVRLLTRAPAPR